MINIADDFTELVWDRISRLAYIKSRRVTTEQFKERLKEINKTIEVMGEYESVASKVLCRCTVCDNEWFVSPGDLFAGKGCPKCGIERGRKKRMLSHSEFIRKLHSINPYLEVESEYKGSKEKIACKCNKCGYRWNPAAGQLISSKPTGCPTCGGTRKLTTAEFVFRMSVVNPSIDIIGEYINTETKIECRCKQCGNNWSAAPHMLKDGHGCPRCSKKKRQKRINSEKNV